MFDWFFGRRARLDRTPVPLVLYTRSGCRLCEDMRDEIVRARLDSPWSLTEIDVDSEPELAIRYGADVPVLWIGGRKTYERRMHAAEFEQSFARLGLEWRRARSLSEDLALHARAQRSEAR